MTQLIITGGTGHIGTNLIYLLSKLDRYKIKLLLLPGEDISIFKGINLEISYGNILDKEYLNREITEGSVVIHLAGYVNISSKDIDKMYLVNYQGTKNIVDVCLKNNVHRLIYTSSVHAIVPLEKEKIMKEPDIIDEQKIIGDYGKSKALATKYVFEKVKEGLPAIVLYPSGVIGPNDYKLSNFGSVILDIAKDKLKAKVKGSYNFVDVRDVAQAIETSITKGKIGKGYILSGENISVHEIYNTINNHLHRKRRIPTLPVWFVKLFSKLAELYYTRRNKKPLFTKYSLYTITCNHNFDNSYSRKNLDFAPRPISFSIIDSLEWFKSHSKY